MVSAAIAGDLDGVPGQPHPVFRVMVPRCCPGVPDHLLDPASQWRDRAAYDTAARALAARFQKNFIRFGTVDPAIAGAGPV
jgi:phosphoenolpyruvate carboxykinase (ATP)